MAACKSLLPDSPVGILISMAYEPQAMEPPPFSVPREEVETLWAGQVALVETVDMLDAMPRAIAAGVERLEEYYWEFPVPGL